MSVTPKLWGGEKLIHAGTHYWMKELCWNPGTASSFHYHAEKDETWYVTQGKAEVLLMPIAVKYPHVRNPFKDPEKDVPKLINEGHIARIELNKGDSLNLPPYMAHQVLASDEGFTVVEASTPHRDADVYRLTESTREKPKYG